MMLGSSSSSAPNWVALHPGQRATFVLRSGTTTFPYHLHLPEGASATIRAEHGEAVVLDKYVWGPGVAGDGSRKGLALECPVQLRNQKTLGIAPPPGTLTSHFLSFDPDEFEKKL